MHPPIADLGAIMRPDGTDGMERTAFSEENVEVTFGASETVWKVSRRHLKRHYLRNALIVFPKRALNARLA